MGLFCMLLRHSGNCVLVVNRLMASGAYRGHMAISLG